MKRVDALVSSLCKLIKIWCKNAYIRDIVYELLYLKVLSLGILRFLMDKQFNNPLFL